MRPSKRKCVRCGKDPAEGFASVWTRETGEQFYCHGDDDGSPTCYEGMNNVRMLVEEEAQHAESMEVWDS